MFLKIFYVCLFVVGQQSLFATKWPQLEKSQSQECPESMAEKILQVAESAFRSSSPSLSSISKTQLGDQLKLLIEQKGTGEDSTLNVCDENFEIIDGNKAENGIGWHQNEVESFRFAVYWQRSAVNGFRFILCGDKVGWRGNMYSLFSIPESLSQDEFITQRKAGSIKPIISDTWCPPLLIQHLPSQQILAIDVGNSFEMLADWKVYLANTSSAPCCIIHFHPSIEKSWDLLPEPVQQLARFLDETLGDGRGDGTMQSTARNRNDAARTWGNVALRPWAVNNAYNTHAEVDSGLSEWSQMNKKFRTLYQKITEQYPKAEQALSLYYQEQFQLPEEKAKRLASYVLDIAFRDNFEFPAVGGYNAAQKRNADQNASKNPWYN